MSRQRAALRQVQAPVTRHEKRCQRFVAEAERLFLAKGYAGTSMADVVHAAGGSLATLYAEFGTKERLFVAVLERRCAEFFETTSAQLPSAGADRRTVLLSLAQILLDRILSPEGLGIYRIVVSEGPRIEELRVAFLKMGVQPFLERLTEVLRGIGIEPASASLAEEFLTLVYGQMVVRAACGDTHVLSRRVRAEHAARAVEAFMVLHGLT